MIGKRGLSAIIVTLIMILLVIVASGIIWGVVRNFVGSGSEQINLGSDCINVDVEATRAVNTSATNYDVTVTRSAGGSDIGGVKIIVTNATGTSSYVHTAAGNIAPLATKTIAVSTTADGSTGISNANKVEILVYFTDASGNEQTCSSPREFSF